MRTYAPLWNKYRPAILKMMIDADNASQSYQLSDHEFVAMSPRKKGSFKFDLHVSNGRAISGMKDSIPAQDLWETLQLSRKATELISDGAFTFSLDNKFVLHITKAIKQ